MSNCDCDFYERRRISDIERGDAFIMEFIVDTNDDDGDLNHGIVDRHGRFFRFHANDTVLVRKHKPRY